MGSWPKNICGEKVLEKDRTGILLAHLHGSNVQLRSVTVPGVSGIEHFKRCHGIFFFFWQGEAFGPCEFPLLSNGLGSSSNLVSGVPFLSSL